MAWILTAGRVYRPARGKALTTAAVREAWTRHQQGKLITTKQGGGLLCTLQWHETGQQQGEYGRDWTAYEVEELQEHSGTKSTQTIAEDLGRTRDAVLKKLRELDLNDRAFRCTCRSLANLLGIDKRYIRLLMNGNCLRWYKEGDGAKIHYEDFDAMRELFHVKQWRSLGVPKHPGKVIYRDELQLTDEQMRREVEEVLGERIKTER